MCIAIVKPYGVKLPNDNLLKKCFKDNPDGAGFAFCRKGVNYISKGFFTYNEFKKQLNECCINENDILFIHFRLTSNGYTKKSLCHPFPITNDLEKLTSTKLRTAQTILMHNGTFKKFVGNNGNITDTMCFCINVFNHKNKSFFNSIEIGDNKIAVMNNEGEFKLFGRWIYHDGCYFSNEKFKNKKINIDNFDVNKIFSKKIKKCDYCKRIVQTKSCFEYDCKNICTKCSKKYNIIDDINIVCQSLFPKNRTRCCYCDRVFSNLNGINIVLNNYLEPVCINCYKKYEL